VEKRLLIAAGLSLAVLLLWELVIPKPRPASPPGASRAAAAAGAAPTPAPSPADAPVAPAVAAAPVSAAAPASLVLENEVLRLTLSNRGGVIESAILPRYREDQKRPLELVRKLPPPAPRPLAVTFPGHADLTEKASAALFAVETVTPREALLRFSDGQLQIEKRVRLSDGYLFDVSVSVVGPAYELWIGSGLRNPTEQDMANRYLAPATAVGSAGGKIEKIAAEKLEKGPARWPVPARGFVGIEDNYFLAVLLPDRPSEASVAPVAVKTEAGKPHPTVSAALSGSGELSARAYFGPKDLEILESLNLGLDRTVDFGWYGILARPLLWLLKRAYTWVGNWGVAILLVTLLIRILLFPLMHKSYASMKKMQKLAPKMNAIRDKYKKAKTDAAQRAKMNQELMTLYQAEGYNPMSGCLPILLQLPILVAFYNVLSRTIELRHAPFVFWIKDLSAMDHTYVLLILMIVSMYVQTAMTPSTADPMQKKIFMAMPLLWAFFLKDMPSGLVLYWLFSNVLTILQQVLINKMVKDEEPQTAPARAEGRRAKAPRARGAGR
jgi:YidC/Oxa1 family membrane protein insertase